MRNIFALLVLFLGLSLAGFVGIKLMLADGIIQAVYASQSTLINVDGFVWGVIRFIFSWASAIILIPFWIIVYCFIYDPSR